MGKVLLMLLATVLAFQAWAAPSRMSLDEAKQVTDSAISQEAFVPPPRRVDDVIKILNQAGTFKGNTESNRIKADAPPPPTQDNQSLVAFYRERGIAAWQLGRYKQTLDDFEKAQHYAGEARITDPQFMQRLAVAELER
ncbi:MAG TPA: hypothetical protein VMT71_03855 [Syntrophorhabdales bacterium]|nr:hypothetical protein [Syntrophorhabdales bacterium]